MPTFFTHVAGEGGACGSGRGAGAGGRADGPAGRQCRDPAAAARSGERPATATTSASSTDSRGCVRLPDVARAQVQRRHPGRGVQPQVAAVGRRRAGPAGPAGRRRPRPARGAEQGVPGRQPAARELPAGPGDPAGWSRSHGSAAQASRDARLERRPRGVRGLVEADAVPALGDERVGHRAGPVAGADDPDRERVGDLVAGNQRVGVAQRSRSRSRSAACTGRTPRSR